GCPAGAATHRPTGGSPEVVPARAGSTCTATACLQGNLRDGHVHFVARSSRSTHTWYGLLPLPRQSPHRACSSCPSPLQLPGAASFAAAAATCLSGADANTESTSMP